MVVHNTTELNTSSGRTLATPICPDHLSIDDLGAADCPRGKLIRAFFKLLKFLWV
jgi:hypothetical protein